jgi:hypothetical protein
VLSYTGDQFAKVAIAILVYGRTHSAFRTALAYALTYLPPIADGPLLVDLAAIPGIPFRCPVRAHVLHRANPLAVLLGAPRRCPTCCLAISTCSAVGRSTAVDAGRSLGASLLVDEGLGDGSAVAVLFWDHDPRAQVKQDAQAAEHRDQGECQAYQGRVNAEVGRQTSAYARDDPPVARPVQALVWIAAWFIHG